MVRQAEPSERCKVSERVLGPNEASEKLTVADLNSESEEVGTWYYVVDCAKCKALIPFKHAPEGEPVLRFPKMNVRCFQCRTAYTYSADLVSRRKAEAPGKISGRDRLPDARDSADETSSYQQEDRNVRDSGGRDIVECQINLDSSPLRRDDIAVEAVSAKRAAIFFLSSCFFAAGWVFQLLLNTLYPVTLAVHSGRRLYGPAVLLETIFFGTVLFGLALFLVGTSSLLVDRYGRKRDFLRKDVSVLPAIKAFIQSLQSRTISWEKIANATSFAQQADGVLSIIRSGAATFRAQIKRSTKLRLRHYR
jgi:hypothetical protein